MFYVRKLTKEKPSLVIRQATAEELYNYKNRFTAVPDDTTSDGSDTNKQIGTCGCACAGDMVFINCTLETNGL